MTKGRSETIQLSMFEYPSHAAQGLYLCLQRLCFTLRRFMVEPRGDLREASEGIIRRYRTARKQNSIQRGFGIHGFIRKGESVSIRNVLDIRNDRHTLTPHLPAPRRPIVSAQSSQNRNNRWSYSVDHGIKSKIDRY